MAHVTKEYESVNRLIKEIEESKVKTQEATIKTETLNHEIGKKVAEVEVKEETAKKVMDEAKEIKNDVETSVRENLDEKKIKAMQGIINNPPEKIKLIVMAVNSLTPTGGTPDNTWEGCKKLVMKAGNFYNGVKSFMEEDGNGQNLTEKKIATAEAYLNQLFKLVKEDKTLDITSEDQMPNYIKEKVSQESYALYVWVKKMKNWFTSKKNYDAQKDILKKATAELNKARLEKQEAEETLERLNSEMRQMEITLKEKKIKLQELEEDLAIKKANLEIAERLVNGLGDEKISWTKERESLNVMYIKLIGDCLLSCAFLTYLGPFESTFRKEIMYQNWLTNIATTTIPYDAE